MLTIGLSLLAVATASSADLEPNTDPITGYWDCCKPACSSSDSPERATFQTCDATGFSPGVYHTGESVCHLDVDTMKKWCPSATKSSEYNAECLMRVPHVQENVLYSYASYTEPKGATVKHQFCGTCRMLTLDTSTESTDGGNIVSKVHIQLVNSKPYPANPGPGAMTGYRLLVPGAGMGDYTSGCACTFPGIYTSEICGIDGTEDTSHCKRFGGMQTSKGCEALEDGAAVKACKEVKLDLLTNGPYARDKGHVKVLKDEPVSCDTFDQVMMEVQSGTHLV